MQDFKGSVEDFKKALSGAKTEEERLDLASQALAPFAREVQFNLLDQIKQLYKGLGDDFKKKLIKEMSGKDTMTKEEGLKFAMTCFDILVECLDDIREDLK